MPHCNATASSTSPRRAAASGRRRRIEIWLQHIDGRYYLSGYPGRRDWYANLVTNPRFTVHLKKTATADLTASARAITEPVERRVLFDVIAAGAGLDPDVMFSSSPLVEVTFPRW